MTLSEYRGGEDSRTCRYREANGILVQIPTSMKDLDVRPVPEAWSEYLQ